jgi:cytoskeleton protein RodZ
MSEPGDVPTALDQPLLIPPVPSAGALLRQARLAEGLHIAALAVTLKVPVKKIEALEADRLDELPDMVFVRALAASICRTLKVAPDPVLERLPPSNLPSLGADATSLNASYRDRGDRAGLAIWERLSRPYGLAILALILGLAAMVFLPLRPQTDSPVSQSPQADTAAPAAATTSVPVVPVTATPVPDAAVTTAVPALTVASAPSDLGAKAVVAGSGTRTGILVLQARGASWVEVTDAKGVVHVRKIMNQGDVQGISGPLPLAVVLGRADAVDVLVRGTPLDIQAATKDKVARFEVK